MFSSLFKYGVPKKLSLKKTFVCFMSLLVFTIKTERLYLVPATVKLYLLELYDRQEFASALKAKVPEEWPPDQITPDLIEEFIGRMKARDRKLWSFYWLLCQKDSELPVLIGNGGFLVHEHETLEIGYSMLSEYQRNGYATEAVRSMLQWASSSFKRARFIAHTNPHFKASIRVLEKNGFSFKGKGQEEGTLLYELKEPN